MIDLKVVNPNSFDLKIISLRGKVEASSQRRCAASAANVRVMPYTGQLPVIVSAGKRAKLKGSFPITMPKGASQTCAGARFTIALVGVGAKASR